MSSPVEGKSKVRRTRGQRGRWSKSLKRSNFKSTSIYQIVTNGILRILASPASTTASAFSNNIDRGLMALLTFLHRFYKVVAISYISSIFRVLRVPFEAHLHYVDQALFGRFFGEWRLHSGFTEKLKFSKNFPSSFG